MSDELYKPSVRLPPVRQDTQVDVAEQTLRVRVNKKTHTIIFDKETETEREVTIVIRPKDVWEI
jgi:hypothetical protein